MYMPTSVSAQARLTGRRYWSLAKMLMGIKPSRCMPWNSRRATLQMRRRVNLRPGKLTPVTSSGLLHSCQRNLSIVIPDLALRDSPGIQSRRCREPPSMDSRLHGDGFWTRFATMARSNYTAIAPIPPRSPFDTVPIWMVAVMSEAPQTLLG
jgi:hypothetical protein